MRLFGMELTCAAAGKFWLAAIRASASAFAVVGAISVRDQQDGMGVPVRQPSLTGNLPTIIDKGGTDHRQFGTGKHQLIQIDDGPAFLPQPSKRWCRT